MRVILVVCLAIVVAVCAAALVFWSTGRGREKIRGERPRSSRPSSR